MRPGSTRARIRTTDRYGEVADVAGNRTPMVAGNWKMYKTSGEGAILVQDLAEARPGRVGRRRGRRVPAVHGDSRASRPSSSSTGCTIGARRAGRLLGGGGRLHRRHRSADARGAALRLLHRRPLRAPRVLRRDERDGQQEGPRAVPAGHRRRSCAAASRSATYEAGETDAFVRAQVREGLAGLTAEQAADARRSPTSRSGRSGPGTRPRPRRPTTSPA